MPIDAPAAHQPHITVNFHLGLSYHHDRVEEGRDFLFETYHLLDWTLKDSEICNIFHRFGRTYYRRTAYATSATGNQRFPMLPGRTFMNRAPRLYTHFAKETVGKKSNL